MDDYFDCALMVLDKKFVCIYIFFQFYILKSQGLSNMFDLSEVTQETCNTGEKKSLY